MAAYFLLIIHRLESAGLNQTIEEEELRFPGYRGENIVKVNHICRQFIFSIGNLTSGHFYNSYMKIIGHKLPKKQEGEICGPCQNIVDNFHCGDCADGLECREHGMPYPVEHDAHGTCYKKLDEMSGEGKPCGACFNPALNNQCGPCAIGLECVPHPQDQSGPPIMHESFGVCTRLKQQGQPCGPCFDPATGNQCGTCASGLKCEARGMGQTVCVQSQGRNQEGEPCGACFSPATNFQCGECAEGLECVENDQNLSMDEPPIGIESFGTCRRTATASGIFCVHDFKLIL